MNVAKLLIVNLDYVDLGRIFPRVKTCAIFTYEIKIDQSTPKRN
jgi:hypothetical protein